MKRSFFDTKLHISCLVLLGMMALFTLTRVSIFLGNHSFFAALSGGEILSAFVNGLRFDFYVTALFMGPVIFLLNLPLRARWWTQLCTTLLLVEMVWGAGFLVGDWVYFPKVGRHIAEEVVQLSSDWGYIVSYVLTQFWWAVALLLGFLGIALYSLYKYINRKGIEPRSWKKTLSILITILLLIVLGLRGHLGGGKAIGVADVYNYVQTSAGAALALNGAFSAYQVGRKGTQDFANTYPLEQALAHTQQFLISPQEKILDEKYPLMRQSVAAAGAAQRKPNVLIVLLESWNPYYVDGISHHNYGATPVFDELAKEGVLFTQAYAAGQRSILGFGAVLAGVPPIPGLPMFGYGLELASLSTMPKHFSQAGYYTFFAQTSHRDSYRMCALASYLGMQESFGWEDMPQRLPYQGKAPFGYDYDAFEFSADQIAAHAGRPFMGMIFTGITHEPFTATLPQFNKYPYDTWEHGFLNTLSFADWSIGQLMDRAKKEGWFDNTIFVFVSDHTAGQIPDGTLKSNFQISLLLYAPKLLPARHIDYVVSQLDLIPTLYKLAGLQVPYTAFGHDMLDPSLPRAAFVSEGSNIGLVTPKGAIRHSGSKILTVEPYSEDFDSQAAQELLLSLDKSARTLLKENRWYHPTYSPDL